MGEPQQSPGPSTKAPRLVVCAEGPRPHRRIAATLAAHGMRPFHQVDSPAEIDGSALDAATILIFLCDVDLAPGMAALRKLRSEQREPALVVISPSATAAGVRRALDAGADAFVHEPELESTLAVAVDAVASGQSVVPRQVRASVEKPALSHRERQVLGFVSRGLTNAQIAERLYLSESTIKSHLASVFAKFGVRSRREAAALFRELEQGAGNGLATVGGPVADKGASEQATT